MEITKEELTIFQDFTSFLRSQERDLIIIYKDIYCVVICEPIYFYDDSIGTSFDFMDNFGNLVLKFIVENDGTINYEKPKTEEDIIEAIQEIKKAIKINEYSADSNIYKKLSLNCCELDEKQLLFRYGKYRAEVENLEGDALISLSFNEAEYPIGYMLVYALDNKIYYAVHDLEEYTNEDKMKLLINGTMQNLITWCML